MCLSRIVLLAAFLAVSGVAWAVEIGADRAADDYVHSLEGRTVVNGRRVEAPIWAHEPIPRVVRVDKVSELKDRSPLSLPAPEKTYFFTLEAAKPENLVGTTAMFYVRLTADGWVIEPPYVDTSGDLLGYAERGYSPK